MNKEHLGNFNLVRCPDCRGTGIESYRHHGVMPSGEACIEAIKCGYCDGFGTIPETRLTQVFVGIVYNGGSYTAAWDHVSKMIHDADDVLRKKVQDDCVQAANDMLKSLAIDRV